MKPSTLIPAISAEQTEM